MKFLRHTVPSKMLCSIVLLWAMMPGQGYGQIISTVVGLGTADNVPAVNTGLFQPVMEFVDAAGNIYFSDHLNHRVRKIDTSGIITTLAGNGTRGFSGDGGPAASALVDHPYGTYVDAVGNIYFCDLFNHRVRKIDTSGIITTVAGNGTPTFSGDGGPAVTASLKSPIGVIMDVVGNLYISTNRHVRRVDPVGTITTFAGNGIAGFSGDDGPAADANLNGPYSMAFDTVGNLYFAETSNQRVRRVDTSGIITTVAGNGGFGFSGDGGSATNAHFSHPWDVAVDPSGNIYIADFANSRIRRVDNATGIITTFAGAVFPGSGIAGDGGFATDALLGGPAGVSVDGLGNLFISEIRNNRIRKIDTSNIITTVGGGGAGDGGPVSEANLNAPYGVALDAAGNLYITDGAYQRIRKIDASNPITRVAGTGYYGFSGDGGPATLADIRWAQNLHVTPSGEIYIPDAHNNRIRKVDLFGTITTVAGSGPAGLIHGGFSGDGGPATNALLNLPLAVHTDAAGNMYISDYRNHRIRKVDTAGIITTIAGTGTQGYSGDGGPALSATMRFPRGIHVDGVGNIYFADGNNHALRKIDTSGIITTVAGTGTPGYSGDGGPAVIANLNRPTGVHMDLFGNLFIAGISNNRIRMVDPSGIITTVAGNGSIGFNGDGILATAASIYNPTDVVTDPSGNLYVADRTHNRIRKVEGVTPPTNQPPVADAGPDQTGENAVECTSPDGAEVTLDGSGSSDPDGDDLTFAWSATNITFDDAAGSTPKATFPLGTTTVTLTISDPGGLSNTDEVDITVEDTTPPDLSVSVSPEALWPPNHKYHTISLTVSTNDACDASLDITATVISNESDDANGNGDGKTTGDIKVTMAGGGVLLSSNAVPEVAFGPVNDQLELRSERSGKGEGRVYTIAVTATDGSEQSSSETVSVTVGHDKGKGAAKFALVEGDLEFGVGNAPNPFNPTTTIWYTLAEASDVRLVIYNVLGQTVRVLAQKYQEAGYYQVRWDGKNAFGRTASTGLYLYKLEAGPNVAVRKMIFAK